MSTRRTLAAGLCLSGTLSLLAWAQEPGTPQGLQIEQGGSAATGGREEQTPAAATRPLEAARVKALLSRLRPIKASADDRKNFALRSASLAAPKTGARVLQPFPPLASHGAPVAVAPGPLQVLRHAPEGDVELAPALSVTFNQPMVALSSAGTPKDVPVKLSPETPGEWRWVGTQTLVFQPKTRLPMATEFRAEVAPITSATGGKLEKPVTWTFRTPPPSLVSSFPSGDHVELKPVLFLQFDQSVDPAQVAKLASLGGNGKSISMRQATEAEVAADEAAFSARNSAVKGRWVALVPSEPLLPGTGYTCTVPAGLSSLEGPRTTSSPLTFSFTTYPALHVDNHAENPRPGSPLYFTFNNELDKKAFKPESVTVTPAIEKMRVMVQGNVLWVRGQTRARTTYKVTLPAGLTDRYGQTLGSAQTVDIKTGDAAPVFIPPGKNFLTLDPSGTPQLAFGVVNHPKLDVRIHSVKPSDWKAFHDALNERYNGKPVALPGKQVFKGQMDGSKEQDQANEVQLDLSKPLAAGSNQLVLEVVPSDLDKDQRRYSTYYGWVQSTQLAVNTASDGQGLSLWVTDLKNGAPIPEAQAQLANGEAARTGADGRITLPLAKDVSWLTVRKGDDLLFMPANSYGADGSFRSNAKEVDQEVAYLTDDRRLYKPKETVAIKGWLRTEQHSPKGGLKGVATGQQLSYVVRDPRGNEIAKGKATVGRLGGFDFKFKLPDNANLGTANVVVQTARGSYGHSIQIQEFRRPEFEVSTTAADGAVVIGGGGSLLTEAKYFSGGGLPNAQVNWSVNSSPTSYSPPHWEGWTFGTWTPWWDGPRWWMPRPSQRNTYKTFQTRTDGSGKSRLDLKFPGAVPSRPYTVQGTATVMDVNRQTFSSSASLLVHPASVYVGIKPESTFVEAGQSLKYRFIVTDLDGKAVAGKPLTVKVERLDYEVYSDDGQPERKLFAQQKLTSAAGPVELVVPTKEGGTYQLTVTVQDEANRSNSSEMTSWVAGGKIPPSRDVSTQTITMIPDKKEYQPGDIASMLVQCPFNDARGLVTLERHGIVERQALEFKNGSATLKVPLDEAYIPNLHVTVEAVGSQPRVDGQGQLVPGKPPQPAQAQGQLDLAISTKTRKLNISVQPDHAHAEPGSANGLQVKVANAGGQPLPNSEVALFVVDESLLALSGGDYQDPWSLFYRMRPAGVSHDGSRQYVELALPEELKPGEDEAPESGGGAPGGLAQGYRGGLELRRSAMPPMPMAAAAPMMDKAAAEPAPPPIKVRSNFSALAFYVPSAKTDAEGRVHLPFKLPDNLTRYRVVALGVSGDTLFGKGESSLTAQQALMVRPSPPRFLNFGDRCELPVSVQNGTDKPLSVEVAARGTNLKLGDSQGVVVQVPANDRVEVRFPVSADSAGRARFQVGAAAGSHADAAEIDFPVWTPATTEAAATYGVLDKGAAVQPVAAPPKVFKQFGGLEISTSSTALAELTDAFIYLQNYPYECAEQISSRLLSTTALLPVLSAFEAPGLPSETELKAKLAADMKRLQGQQNSDGGWDWWVRERASVPYVSLHTTHALLRVKKSGHAVPETTLNSALNYVTTLDQHFPADYTPQTRHCLRAYAVYLQRLAGKPNPGQARMTLAGLGGSQKAPLECLGWMLNTLADDPASKDEVIAIRKRLNNQVTETASTAAFATSYQDGSEHLLLSSDRRDDAILLEALMEDQPKLDLIPKLVRGLLDGRKQGRWESTQENCWVLLALQKYFETYEKVTPNFVARLWLGEQSAGQQQFRGRQTATQEIRIPMAEVPEKQTNLTVAKDGPGRLYYRLGMRYAPLNLNMEAMERGFSVQRSYSAADDNRDVRHDADGTWHIKAGSRVKTTVTMAAPSRRYHVALVDPLPAGLEPINSALQGSEPNSRSDGPDVSDGSPSGWMRWWNPWWYEHENLRDERAEAFSSYLWEGVYEYSYYTRATTPGHFVVPPAKAEEMYQPETFGRSASDKVVVDP